MKDWTQLFKSEYFLNKENNLMLVKIIVNSIDTSEIDSITCLNKCSYKVIDLNINKIAHMSIEDIEEYEWEYINAQCS